jgi:hypothetical protein
MLIKPVDERQLFAAVAVPCRSIAPNRRCAQQAELAGATLVSRHENGRSLRLW